jgi:hypothetical protein
MRTSNWQAIAAERPAAVGLVDWLSVRDYESSDDACHHMARRLETHQRMWAVKDFGKRARRTPPEVRDHARAFSVPIESERSSSLLF